MTLQEHLLPCPFCGGKAEFVKVERFSYPFRVRCTVCCCTTGGSAFENNSYNLRTWNRRSK